jgi:hypothetical protein
MEQSNDENSGASPKKEPHSKKAFSAILSSMHSFGVSGGSRAAVIMGFMGIHGLYGQCWVGVSAWASSILKHITEARMTLL